MTSPAQEVELEFIEKMANPYLPLRKWKRQNSSLRDRAARETCIDLRSADPEYFTGILWSPVASGIMTSNIIKSSSRNESQ